MKKFQDKNGKMQILKNASLISFLLTMELLIHQIFTNNLGIIKKTPKVVIKTKKKQIDK